MTGDFSRDSHQPGKWQAVLLQQGRVTLDADWNEQAAIAAHRDAQGAQAAIGRVGRPKGEWVITTTGGNIAISPGTLWIDGVPCVASVGTSLLNQPFRPLATNALTALGDVQAGVGTYALVLTAWRRTVDPVMAPELLEPALGGADTAAREQWVWQLSLRRWNPPAGASCANPGTGWQLPPADGRMTARTVAPATPADPCQIPPTAQYRGLGNQLYRIEIHREGDLSTARFKWSRENGSVATALVQPSGGATSTSGPSLTVAGLGRDAETGFAAGQWVELEDEILALGSAMVPLRKILSANAAAGTITLAAAAALPVTHARGARLRRWDQTAGDESGLPLGTGVPIEHGLVVDFSAGRYRRGDYWLVPARTAVANVAGDIVWPRSGGTFLPQASQRIEHTALLTVVNWNGSQFTRLPAFGDCVPTFPPLTAITASDVSYTPQPGGPLTGTTNVQDAIDKLATQTGACSVVVRPGTGWESVFASLPAGDLDICFQAGDFVTPPDGITISGNRRVRLGGAGPGTRVRNIAGEAALQFTGLSALRVHDIAVSGTPTDAKHLNGAINVVDCNDVEISGVSASTAAAEKKASSAISVRNAPSAKASVVIRNCRVTVGGRQHGILIVNADRAEVTDNSVVADLRATGSVASRQRLKDKAMQRRLVKHLAKGRRGRKGELAISPLARKLFPRDVDSLSALGSEVRKLAKSSEMSEYNGAALDELWALLKRLDAPEYGARGICIAGSKVNEAIVRGNSIRDFRSNIHVAVSHHEGSPGKPDIVNALRVEDNDIVLAISGSDEASGSSSPHAAPYGIFIGNTDDVVIAGNRVVNRSIFDRTDAHAQSAIVVLGHIGRRLLVRENRITGFRVAVTVPRERAQGLWRMTDNLADHVTTLLIGQMEMMGSENVRIG